MLQDFNVIGEPIDAGYYNAYVTSSYFIGRAFS
jgi:hypothetical protein